MRKNPNFRNYGVKLTGILSESAKEGWKRESVCREDHTSYAAAGSNADSSEENLRKSILLKKSKK